MLQIQAIAFDYDVRATFQRMRRTETINKIIRSFIIDHNHITDIIELQQSTQWADYIVTTDDSHTGIINW